VSTIVAVEIDEKFQRFKGVMLIHVHEFVIEAYLLNEWDKPFGLKSLKIYEAGIKVGIVFEGAFSFGINGKFLLVETTFDFIIAFDPVIPSENVFYAMIENLNFTTFVKGVADASVPKPLDEFTDNFLLVKGQLSVAPPQGCTMFGREIPGGIYAEISMIMFDFEFTAKVQVNDEQVLVYGHCSPVDTEYFKLSSFNATSEGPTAAFNVTRGQHTQLDFFLDASMSVFGIDSAVLGIINQEGLIL